jgi:hypothetical protein
MGMGEGSAKNSANIAFPILVRYGGAGGSAPYREALPPHPTFTRKRTAIKTVQINNNANKCK